MKAWFHVPIISRENLSRPGFRCVSFRVRTRPDWWWASRSRSAITKINKRESISVRTWWTRRACVGAYAITYRSCIAGWSRCSSTGSLAGRVPRREMKEPFGLLASAWSDRTIVQDFAIPYCGDNPFACVFENIDRCLEVTMRLNI